MTESLSQIEIGLEGECPGNLILIRAAKMPEKTKGNIIIPSNSRSEAERHIQIGKVLRVGDMAYKSEAFNEKVWCKEGDWIIFSSYESMRINLNEHVCYFINDHRVSWVVEPGCSILTNLE